MTDSHRIASDSCSKILSIPFQSMFFFYKILILNFIFTKQLIIAQTLIQSSFDQAFLPLGSQATSGRLLSRCNRRVAPTVFSVRNNCPFTVWAAAVPGGGQPLKTGQAWTLNLPATTMGRVWGRTNCSFHDSGSGKCETGDCNGNLRCQSYGAPPNTIVEFTLNSNSMNLDFFDISLVDGFNIPIEFRPASNGCDNSISCTAEINGECPAELRAAGGCNNPCTVFKTSEYCCDGLPANCRPTSYSKFFKDRCPNVYTYPYDDKNTTFTCPAGTSYDVVFCP